MTENALPGTMPVAPATAPERVQVQHVLIGFAGSVPGKRITRTQEEARSLALDVLDKARRGEVFDELVKRYTDDGPPGIYALCAPDVRPSIGEYRRDQMVPAFGDVGFRISPGNIDVAEYDAIKSPYGWHVIKRLK